ncbi:PLP-dependent transferase [Coprinopsis marcescibilis]|uniref:PLP-dependent transferase n=1 Tax=Coprinopsis marcescibilis TaxID=230819 RepID=A0A5C3L559_COPMA|nr:PLP-dependent transferase [Coprinopsis marcescibilis]
MWEELRDILEKRFKLRQVDFTYGDSLYGSIRLRDALANFFNNYFKPFSPVSPDNLLMGNGLLSLISQLGRALIDPGHGVLLAAPYYHGFDISFSVHSGVRVVGAPVPFEDMFTSKELDHLEKVLADSEAKGVPIRAVLLCNPQNPYGRCYPPELITAYCQFCERHNLHLISDEIYALSTFASDDLPNAVPFTSVLSLDLESLNVNPQRIHMVYGMSKDFDANGFRAGVLYTRNEMLLHSLLATSLFMLVGSPSAGLWYSLLSDQTLLNHFIQRNQTHLRESYEHMSAWLRFHNIPYLPSSAGHFIMVNFRPILADTDRYISQLRLSSEMDFWDREAALTAAFLANGVLVSHGQGFHMYEGGWMRFTFSLKREMVDVALDRIERALGWDRWPGGSPELSDYGPVN